MPSKPRNALYAQSGGPTAVINASASGLILAARRARDRIGHLYAARDGIIGALTEDLIDTHKETLRSIEQLANQPGAAFGTCRYKLAGIDKDRAQYERLIEVFKAHDIGYFFYNGGNDSQDTAWKVAQLAEQMDYPLVCIGVPKTVDNDLPHTDCCPGFGSAAKYLACSIREAGHDVASMARTSTKVFVMEVMGRNAGWLAAATGLASEDAGMPPHIILFPEIAFDRDAFYERVKDAVKKYGHCVVAVSEGLRDASGKILAESGAKDAFGHPQLGGIAPQLAGGIQADLNMKVHWSVPDYLQRSARHIASRVDAEQAFKLGEAAVKFALAGRSSVMATIERLSDAPYKWKIGSVPLSEVANVERKMPREYINKDGYHITAACRRYLAPLIQGEDVPPFRAGLPAPVSLKKAVVRRRLASDFTP
jgi:ATP-dependent phosphofructokinase / diphosphate-dependent phosphofructokinase